MVDNGLLQDNGAKKVIIGWDVEALSPSLEAVEVADIVCRAIMNTKVKFAGINYQEACKYKALTSTEAECRMGPLKRVLPRTRHKNGSRPGITGGRRVDLKTSGSSQTSNLLHWKID